MVNKMKKIFEQDFNPRMGILYNITDEPKKLNDIKYDKLLTNHQTLLNKEKPVYLTCLKGIHSKRAGQILEYYGYDITLVIK